MTIRRKISIVIVALVFFFGGLLYLYNQIYLAMGINAQSQTVAIEKGDNALIVGAKLEKYGIIKNKLYLAYYLWKNKELHGLVAGVYSFVPGLKIPEIARIITGGEIASTAVPITFPEGWTAKEMAARLDANGFSGADFLNIVNNPPQDLIAKYDFLGELKASSTLEGYLFPDTYYFAKDASSRDIAEKMLRNFGSKISDTMKKDLTSKNQSLFDAITMASIVEKEAKYPEDMKTVASVFYNRLAQGQRLESDATLEYVLANNKVQHNAQDLQNPSPYNTYRTAGLPPGPVSNPGMNAITAAVYPAQTDYLYFLTDLKTQKTVFAKTFDQHVANKAKYGL